MCGTATSASCANKISVRNSRPNENEMANNRSTFGPLTGFNPRRYVAQDNSEMFWPCQEGGVCTV